MSIGLDDRNALDALCQHSVALPGSSSILFVIIIHMCVSHLMDYYPSLINTYASKCHLVNHPFHHILHLHLNISIKYQMGLHLKTMFNFETNIHSKYMQFLFSCVQCFDYNVYFGTRVSSLMFQMLNETFQRTCKCALQEFFSLVYQSVLVHLNITITVISFFCTIIISIENIF